jgi:hypothetical protein
MIFFLLSTINQSITVNIDGAHTSHRTSGYTRHDDSVVFIQILTLLLLMVTLQVPGTRTSTASVGYWWVVGCGGLPVEGSVECTVPEYSEYE